MSENGALCIFFFLATWSDFCVMKTSKQQFLCFVYPCNYPAVCCYLGVWANDTNDNNRCIRLAFLTYKQNETSVPAPNFQLLRLMERTVNTEELICVLLVSHESSWRLQQSALKNHRRRPQITGKDSNCELIEEWILQQKQFIRTGCHFYIKGTKSETEGFSLVAVVILTAFM